MKLVVKISCIWLFFLVLQSCKNNEGTPLYFEYQNPISKGIDAHGLRDCQVLKDGDWWYLTGTAYPHSSNAKSYKGVPLYKSQDLVSWEFVDHIITRPQSDSWYYNNFWAPEIQKIKGKYYAIFNCRNPKVGYDWQHMGYAVADAIEGPYTVVTEDKPLAKGNDLTFFEDEDGKVYAFWHTLDDAIGEVDRDFGIGFAEIDLAKAKFITTPQSAIKPGRVTYEKDSLGRVKKARAHGRIVNQVKQYHDWDAAGIEGAYVVKRAGVYYLFYSSWTRGYEIGYATASQINGPWVKAANNPVYGAINEKLAIERGFPFLQDADNPFYAVGHNEVFQGVDGRLWLSCHGEHRGEKAPFLVIDPIDFDAQGAIVPKAPTYTKQRVPLTKKNKG